LRSTSWELRARYRKKISKCKNSLSDARVKPSEQAEIAAIRSECEPEFLVPDHEREQLIYLAFKKLLCSE
jgi:hypothetical protein